jgi:hypothetical protein
MRQLSTWRILRTPIFRINSSAPAARLRPVYSH